MAIWQYAQQAMSGDFGPIIINGGYVGGLLAASRSYSKDAVGARSGGVGKTGGGVRVKGEFWGGGEEEDTTGE